MEPVVFSISFWIFLILAAWMLLFGSYRIPFVREALPPVLFFKNYLCYKLSCSFDLPPDRHLLLLLLCLDVLMEELCWCWKLYLSAGMVWYEASVFKSHLNFLTGEEDLLFDWDTANYPKLILLPYLFSNLLSLSFGLVFSVLKSWSCPEI